MLHSLSCFKPPDTGFAVRNLIEGWQTDNDLAEMQAISQVTQKRSLVEHRNLLESLLLQHKPALAFRGVTVITADKFHTITAALKFAKRKLRFPDGTPTAA